MNLIFTIFALLALTSCGCFNIGKEIVLVDIVDVESISRVIVEYSTELEHTRHLTLKDSYVEYENHMLKNIRIEYQSQDVLEMREARAVIVDVVENFLVQLNGIPDLQEEIGRTLTANDLQIFIDYNSYHTRYVNPDYVAFVYMYNGFTSIYAGTVRNHLSNNWHVRHESYQESLAVDTFYREGYDIYNERRPGFKESSLGAEQYIPYDR